MDIRTLMLVNLIFLFLYAAIIALNARFYGAMCGARWFAWSNFFRGLGWVLFSLRTVVPGVPLVSLGDVCMVVGLLCLHRSLAEVLSRGRTGWRLQVGIGVTVLVGLVFCGLFYSGHPAALMLASVSLAVQLGVTTGMLFSRVAPGMRGAVWFTGGILFLYALVEMTGAVGLIHSGSGVLQVNPRLLTALMIATLLANGGTAFGFMFLSSAQLRRELTRLAEHDALTGVLNRRGLKALADRTLRSSHRAGEPVSAVMLDLDGMKVANDTWGHECGDAILCAVANFLVATVGRAGAVARLGGDEFLVVLPGVAECGAVEMAETLRRGIERLHTPRVRPKASFGVASMTGQSWEEAVRKSDHALYEAKNAGRNRVKCYA